MQVMERKQLTVQCFSSVFRDKSLKNNIQSELKVVRDVKGNKRRLCSYLSFKIKFKKRVSLMRQATQQVMIQKRLKQTSPFLSQFSQVILISAQFGKGRVNNEVKIAERILKIMELDGIHSRPLKELSAVIASLQSLKKIVVVREDPLQPKSANRIPILKKSDRGNWGIIGHINPSKDHKACPLGIHF